MQSSRAQSFKDGMSLPLVICSWTWFNASSIGHALATGVQLSDGAAKDLHGDEPARVRPVGSRSLLHQLPHSSDHGRQAGRVIQAE